MRPASNIIQLFLNAASQHPDETAIIYKHEKITYRLLSEDVIATANYFAEKGIEPGDRILVFVPMSLELYKTLLAAFYLGAVVVFLDEWVNKERMELCCRIAKCKGFIAPFKIRLLGMFSKEIRNIQVKLSPNKKSTAGTVQLFQPIESDPALITFTTGSTGTPKAANRTHHFLSAQYKALQPLLPADSKIDMALLPIVLLLNLGTGKTSVIGNYKANKPGNFNPSVIYAELKNNNVTSLTFSPYYLITLAQYLVKNNLRLPAIKNILSGGGPVFPPDAKLILQAFPFSDFTIIYGSTEAEPIAHINAKDFIKNYEDASNGLCVGNIDDAAKVKIIPIENKPVDHVQTLQEGETGEIIVSGNHVLQSYLDNETAFKQNKIVEGDITWHRTGDAGYLDDEGDLFLAGRCKQIIEWEGRKYYPFLIENIVKNIQGINCGTIMVLENIPVIVIEADENYQSTKFAEVLFKNYLSEFRIIQLKKIPKDKRHHTKIDYDLLQSLLN
ncbi:MAG: AMP-binding protein [Fimbriimonadaceae bacterium]|nr:AMP-binding protein [Chitinophagales bacterium]